MHMLLHSNNLCKLILGFGLKKQKNNRPHILQWWNMRPNSKRSETGPLGVPPLTCGGAAFKIMKAKDKENLQEKCVSPIPAFDWFGSGRDSLRWVPSSCIPKQTQLWKQKSSSSHEVNWTLELSVLLIVNSHCSSTSKKENQIQTAGLNWSSTGRLSLRPPSTSLPYP